MPWHQNQSFSGGKQLLAGFKKRLSISLSLSRKSLEVISIVGISSDLINISLAFKVPATDLSVTMMYMEC